MKIFHISPDFHPQRMVNQSFSRVVDYGAKDKDLVYVPILFEEDTFTPSSESQPAAPDANGSDGAKRPPKKLNTIIKRGGAVLAGIQVVPDVAQSAMNKVSDLLNTTKDFAKTSIDNVSEVKEYYREKFPKSKQDAHNTKEEPDEFSGFKADSPANANISEPNEPDEFAQFGNSTHEHPENPDFPESGSPGTENPNYGDLEDNNDDSNF